MLKKTPCADTEPAQIQNRFSAVCLAFCVYTVVSSAAVFGVTLLLRLTGFSSTPFYEKNPGAMTMVLSTIPMYVFGIPAFYLALRRLPAKKCEKKAMPPSELFVLVLISRFFVCIGSYVSNIVITLLESLTGKPSTDSTTNLISQTPVWLITLLVVFVAPIVEELLFRRAVLDRLSCFGPSYAVLFSAVIFALSHGNFYQFFYTFLLGLLLGYIYVKTGKITYVIGLHILTNFLGSVAILPVETVLIEFSSFYPTLMENPENLDLLFSFGITKLFVLLSYFVLHYGFVFFGIVFFHMYYRNFKNFSQQPSALPRAEMAKLSYGNVGFLLFFSIFVITFIYEF